jgi:protease PrsW
VIIVLGTVAGLVVILMTAANPVGTAIGFVLSSVAMAVVLLAYLWLDRWEPEPRRLLVLAFLWGASVAVVISVALELLVDSWINPGGAKDSFASGAISAPLVEEAAKGLFLLIMMTGRRRNELNSLTDCLVYAGVTAAGFAWLEDIMYIAKGGSLAESLVTAAMRLIMAPFAHPLFTSLIGIGVYFALQQRNSVAKFGHIALGYISAVIMHGLWNASSLLGAQAYFLVYLLWMVPIFVLAVRLSVASRRREQRVVADKLPGMVAANVVSQNEATWLGSIRDRNLAINEATRIGGRPEGKAVKNFAAQVVELAFVRARIDRGFGDERVFAVQTEDAYGVYAARAAAPVLQGMAGYRAPNPPPPGQPMDALPTEAYTSWIRRVGAYIIDTIPVAILLGAGPVIAGVIGGESCTTDPNTGTVSCSPSGMGAILAVIFYLVALAYWIWNWGYRQGTSGSSIGKSVLKFKVVSERTGQPIGFGMSVVRQIAHFLDGICDIGYLLPLFTAKRQTIADMIMNTVCLRRDFQL